MRNTQLGEEIKAIEQRERVLREENAQYKIQLANLEDELHQLQEEHESVLQLATKLVIVIIIFG